MSSSAAVRRGRRGSNRYPFAVTFSADGSVYDGDWLAPSTVAEPSAERLATSSCNADGGSAHAANRAAEAQSAEGPSAEGPSAEGPSAEGPRADGEDEARRALRHGHGRLKANSGVCYEGQWRWGERCGHGRWTHPAGDWYYY